jgi:hypothetical protein
VSDIDYTFGNNIFETLAAFSTNYPPWRDQTETSVFPEYDCVKLLVNLWCGTYYPACPKNGAIPVLPVCQSVCLTVVDICSDYVDYFEGPVDFPDSTFCVNNYKFNTPGGATPNCFIPTNSTSSLGYFYTTDPPFPLPTSPPPTDAPKPYDPNKIIYPPGGAEKGGAIGGGIIAGILVFIGLLTLIMKKQDSR